MFLCLLDAVCNQNETDSIAIDSIESSVGKVSTENETIYNFNRMRKKIYCHIFLQKNGS